MHRLLQRSRLVLFAAIFAALLGAHPMGNFSVNHYARIQPRTGGAGMLYVIDLAEIPTFELLQQWNLQATSPREELERRAQEEARGWVRNLEITIGGHKVQPRFGTARMTLTDGVGGMKVMRVEVNGTVSGSGKLEYQDRNYPERTGWKEIVIGDGPDRSQALTAYPQDATIPQPQELRASIDIGGGGSPAVVVAPAPAPVIQPAAPLIQPAAPLIQRAEPPPATAATPPQAESNGSLKRGDYLSTVLHGGEITFGVALLCMAAAFGLGALHAFEPGHGKTMVAAYLVGSRGTPKHAVLLGMMTTFTHTVSVFLLGFVTIFLSRYIMPEKMTKVLGVVSGLSIVWIGGLMLYRRAGKLVHSTAHDHGHHHDHPHAHSHAGVHDHAHEGAHAHAPHVHSHGATHADVHDHANEPAHAHAPHAHSHEHAHADVHDHAHEAAHAHAPHDHSHGAAHSHSHGHEHGHSHGHDHAHPHHHMPEGEITMGNLMALGASGGMVPCPAALILLLTAISLGRPGFGVLLLLAFSVGLAIVLMATGLVVLYAKHLIPEKHRNSESPFMRAMPIFSAAVIVVIGAVMTGVSLGWIPAVRFFG